MARGAFTPVAGSATSSHRISRLFLHTFAAILLLGVPSAHTQIQRLYVDTKELQLLVDETHLFKLIQILKELTGKERDVPQLKGFWRRSKIAAKKSVALHRSALRATGGGEKPRSPPPTDQIIMEMCPTDFVEDQNQFDSDSAQNKTAVVDEENHDGIILYDIDIDPNEDIDDYIEKNEDDNIEFVNEIITVADVHNPEIDIKSCGKEGKSSNIFKPPPSKIKKPEIKEKEKYPRDNTSKADLIATTITIKKRAMQLMEEEFALKIEYQHKELAHQQLRHKLEIDILLAEKTKKQLENEILKKKLQD